MAEALRVAISGAGGRMGHALAALIGEDPSLAMTGGVDRMPEGGAWIAAGGVVLRAPQDAAAVIRDADVVIDFSAPDCLCTLASLPREVWTGTALVVGTTGLGPDEERALEALAEVTPVLRAANFSVGVNLLLDLVERAARVLDGRYDVEIVETHHRRKEDAPSGTALELGSAVAHGRAVPLDAVRLDGRSGRPGTRPAGEIGFHAVRGGDVVGEHRVLFLGERERIELAHAASDRSLFAEGALRAARWLVGRAPGRYGMRDLLGLDG